MKEELKNKVREAITFDGKKIQITLQEGTLININAITFSQILNFILGSKSRDVQMLRAIKKEIIRLIDDKVIVELNGEPPYYFLKEEFESKIGTTNNIKAIEGLAK